MANTPIVVTPGQSIPRTEWDALLEQHGLGSSTVARPATPAEQAAADDRGDDLQQNPIYRQYTHDGSYVEYRTAPNGDYLIVDYHPSPKFQQDPANKPAATGQATTDAVPRIEGTPLPGGGFDNEAPVQVWRRPDGTVVKTEPLTGPERTKWEEDRQKSRNPGQKTDAQVATDAKADDTTVVSTEYTGTGKNRQKVTTYKSGRKVPEAAPEAEEKPGAPTLKPDGKGGTVAVQTMPDGTIKTTPLPGVPSEAQSKYTEVKQDPVTGKWHGLTAAGAWEELQGGPSKAPDKTSFAVEPAGAPAASTSYGHMMEGLPKYRDFLNQQVQAKNLTPEAANALMATRIAQVEATYKEQNNVVDTQTGLYSTGVTERGQTLRETESRRGDAGKNFQGVLGNFMPLLKYLPATAAEPYVDSMLGLIGEGQRQATAWGGMRETPNVQMGPMAAEANRVGPMAPGSSFVTPYAPPAPAVAPSPAVAPVAAPVPDPNAAAAMAAQQAAQAAATPDQQPGRYRNPEFIPPQLGQGQDLSTPAAPPAPAPAPPAAPSAPAPIDDADTVTIRSATGGTLRVPRGMVGEGPGQYSSRPERGGYQIVEEAAAPQAMAQPAGQGNFVQPYAQPQMPMGSGAQMMFQDPDLDNNILARVYQETYGTPMPGWPPQQQVA